jgi:hypothetical protein
VRNAAGERAHGIHLLGLRHLRFQRLLLGGLHRIDDRGLFRRLFRMFDHRVDVEAEMPLLVVGAAAVDRRDVALLVGRLGNRILERLAVVLAQHGLKQRSALHVIARHQAVKHLQERPVGSENLAVAVDRGDRHRRIVEEAGEAHLRARRVMHARAALFAADDDGPAFARRTVAGGRNPVHQPHRQALAVGLEQIEIELRGAVEPRFGLHRFHQRHAGAGNQIAQHHLARQERGQVDAQPVGQRRVEIDDLAVAAGREEANRRMIEIVDGVLQLLEHHFLLGALMADIGQLPRHQRDILFTRGDRPAAQPVPVARIGALLAGAQRLRHAEFFLSLAPLAHGVGQPVDGFGRFPVARQDRLDRLHVGRTGRAGQPPVGVVGIDHAALLVRDQRAFGMGVDEGAGQRVGGGLRHDVDEADHRGDEKEDPDHRQHAENAEHQLIVEPVLEQEEGDRRADHHQREEDQPRHRAWFCASVYKRCRVAGRRCRLGHESLFRPATDPSGLNHIPPLMESPNTAACGLTAQFAGESAAARKTPGISSPHFTPYWIKPARRLWTGCKTSQIHSGHDQIRKTARISSLNLD